MQLLGKNPKTLNTQSKHEISLQTEAYFMPLSKYCPNKKASKQKTRGSEIPHLQRHSQSTSKHVVAEHHQSAQSSDPSGSCQICSTGTFQQFLLWLTCTAKGLHLPRRVWCVRNNQPTNQRSTSNYPSQLKMAQ